MVEGGEETEEDEDGGGSGGERRGREISSSRGGLLLTPSRILSRSGLGQRGQVGMVWLKMSSRTSSAPTRCRHLVQLAVANEPWHWITRLMPAT